MPKNMIRRRGKKGFWFKKVVAGRPLVRYLGSDYQEALRRLRSLKVEDVPPTQVTIRDAAFRWIESYVKTVRRKADWQLAEQRVRDYLIPRLGHVLLHRLNRDHLRGYR